MTPRSAIAATLAAVFLTACGTTRISVANGTEYDIYVDNRLVGNGTARIDAIGTPHTATVEARDGEQVMGSVTMSREIEVGTVVLGCFSYFTALYWAQYYPDFVVIPVRNQALNPGGSASRNWNAPLQPTSKWEKPLNESKAVQNVNYPAATPQAPSAAFPPAPAAKADSTNSSARTDSPSAPLP